MIGDMYMNKQPQFVLFDLDGTLVPLPRDQYEPALFHNVSGMFRREFPNQPVAEAMKRAALGSFQDDTGLETNEARLRRLLRQEIGDLGDEVLAALEKHYVTDFNRISELIQDQSVADEALSLVEACGGIPVLATNPIMSAAGIHARLGWVGVSPDRFRLITTYDKFHFTKPDPRFYQELMELLRAEPSQCIMIGNDTDEDMEAARQAGMDTYLVTDYVMDRRGSIEQYRHGTSRELLEFLKRYLTR